MRKKTVDEKKYDDTPAFREWQNSVRSVAWQKGRVADNESEVVRAQKRLEDLEKEEAYWRGIVEVENGTKG